MEPTESIGAPPTRRDVVKWAKRVLKLLIIVLIACGIWFSFQKAQRDLSKDEFQWSEIRPLWLIVSGAIYFVATLPGWWFWHLTMRSLGQQPRPLISLRAYTLGQLGKYVPGKALVVVLRASGVKGPGVDWFVAAAAVFVETLTMIAVGSALSGVLLIILFRSEVHTGLLLGAVALALVSCIPTIPTVFRFVVMRLQRRSQSTLQGALRGLNASLILRGWVMMTLVWVLMGLSLWAAAQAVPGPNAGGYFPTIQDLSLHTACIALAVVLGFASFVPGGVGARELVVTTVLASDESYSTGHALVVAILLRIVWLLSELVVSAILVAVVRNRPAQVSQAIRE